MMRQTFGRAFKSEAVMLGVDRGVAVVGDLSPLAGRRVDGECVRKLTRLFSQK
jgi:hypothetical protein